MLLPLCGCGIPMGVITGLSAAGGVVTLLKDVVQLDVALKQDTPGKMPIVEALTPEPRRNP